MQLATRQNEDIIQYYDDCHVDYQIVWHLNSKLCMHYGYWDESTPNLRSALVNMNIKVAEQAGVREGERILDAGCGVGGSSIFLAEEYRCQVEGITLSNKQASFADEKAVERGVDQNVHFSVSDFHRTDFPDEHFDLVWAIESVCHSPDKGVFFDEAYRLLKKGGRLIIADFFKTDYPSQADAKGWMQKWENSWAVHSFDTVKEFKRLAHRSGFNSFETVDITENIYPTARRLYYCFIPGLICDGFLKLLGRRSSNNHGNVWSTLYQYKALRAGLWEYNFFSACK